MDLRMAIQTSHQDQVPKILLLSRSPVLELTLDLFPDIDGRSLSSSADTDYKALQVLLYYK